MDITTRGAEWLAVAGIVAPAGFTTSALVHSLLRTDHRLVPDPVSALAAGSTGWIQNVTFGVAGVLLAAFAVGLHLVLRPGRAGVAGPALLALSGFGLVGAGVFPATDAAGAFADDRILHFVAAVMAFLGAGSGLFVLAWRLAGDPAWRSLASYTRATGVVILALLLAGGALARPPGAPLHEWLGLSQWLLLAVWFPAVVVLALRLHSVLTALAAVSRPAAGSLR